ncbi:aflatoxin B1-aldehyde reductase [Karstenula rhodostoma CBS 690.94]|uniref:Aflatoxin B1-aldehyde reductase n=1 Tax=Karstenula rhodostoma CBS 690.94 TaxID=1392251 RepID=A0A9P4UFY9_9PLEO|nr:aflatoxin B1-aldehyde reductase [Karstenula rhodostoma CBS 690.94]
MAAKNRIILGLMTFGPDVEWGAKTTSLEEFGTFLDHFQAAGYNEGDTARTYQNGAQEGFTAAVNYKKRNLTIATKLYPLKPGKHEPQALRESFEESLKQLQTDYVDIFYLHAPDRSVPFERTLEAVNELYKEGKLKQFGLSNYAAFEVAEIAIICRDKGWVRPTIYQACYNAISGLAGGLFTGKYKAGKTEAPKPPSFVENIYRARYLQDGNLAALSIIEPVVTAHGLTLIEVALRWLVHHSALKMRTGGGNDGIIIGASSLSQLDTNLAQFEKGPLPKEVVDALDEGWLVAKATSGDYWHLDLKYTYDTQEALFGKSA